MKWIGMFSRPFRPVQGIASWRHRCHGHTLLCWAALQNEVENWGMSVCYIVCVCVCVCGWLPCVSPSLYSSSPVSPLASTHSFTDWLTDEWMNVWIRKIMVEKDKVALVGDKSGNLDPERRNQRASTSSKYNPRHGFEFESKSNDEHLVLCHFSSRAIILVCISPTSSMTTFCVRVCYSVCVCVCVCVCYMECVLWFICVSISLSIANPILNLLISFLILHLIAYFLLYFFCVCYGVCVCVCVCVVQTYPTWKASSLSPLLPRVDSATALQELVRHCIRIFGRRWPVNILSIMLCNVIVLHIAHY